MIAFWIFYVKSVAITRWSQFMGTLNVLVAAIKRNVVKVHNGKKEE